MSEHIKGVEYPDEPTLPACNADWHRIKVLVNSFMETVQASKLEAQYKAPIYRDIMQIDKIASKFLRHSINKTITCMDLKGSITKT